MTSPHRKLLDLDAFRHRVADADALPQMAFLGTVAGLITGVVMLLFRGLIHLPLEFALPNHRSENFEALPPAVRFALVLGGAAALGLALRRVPPEQRQVGIGHVIQRLRLHQGHLPWRNAIVQFCAGVFALLTGQSGGREGPAVHLGAATSSMLGQAFFLPNNSIRTLVACGTAAAIAGSFNTPLAGIVFAMEVVLVEYNVAGFVPVVLAAVTSTLIGQAAFGDHTAFDVPDEIRLHGFAELPSVMLEGLLIGALAAGFIALCARLTRIERGTLTQRFLLAGAVTATVSLFAPQVMGIGYDTLEAALDGRLAAATLVLIAIAKFGTSVVTVGLRMPVGLIGPILVIGACAGGALGQVFNVTSPALAGDPALHVMLGMAAMMGATLHAPLAALLAVVELTGNPNATLPAMLAIVVATITARTLFRQRGIFVELSAAQGQHQGQSDVLAHLDRTGVASVMERRIARLPLVVSLRDAAAALDDAPDWIVAEGQRGPRFVLAPTDLRAAIASHAGAPEVTLDLESIPALRLDVVSVDFQATMREAWARLERSNAEALCIRRVVAPLVAPTLGVLTREACRRFVHSGD